MKYLPALTLALLISVVPLWSQAASGPFFQGSFEQARQQALTSQHKLLVKFGASWCMPCVWMDKNVFQHPEAAPLLSAGVVVISVDLDSQDGKALRDKFSIRMLPTLLLVDPVGDKILSRRDEALDLGEFLEWLSPLLSTPNTAQNREQDRVMEDTAPQSQAAANSTDQPDQQSRVQNPVSGEEQAAAPVENKSESRLASGTTDQPALQLQAAGSPVGEWPVQDQEERFFKDRDAGSATAASADKNIPARDLETLATQQDKRLMILGSYYLKTGKYDDLEAAMAEVNRLDELFNQQAALVEDFDKDGELYFSISLGSFATVEEAELFLQLLKRQGIRAEIARLEI